MKKNAHVAIHVSKRNKQVTTIIQPRNDLGQFESPSAKYARYAYSFHTTHNGNVGTKGRVS